MVINRESERRRIIKSFDVFSLSEKHRTLVLEALDSDRWDWYEDCDGCTGVSEFYWPTRFFPPCLRHDFDCIRGKGDWTASHRFYGLQLAYGVPVWRAFLRAAAVTFAWYCWGRRRHST